MVWFTDKKDPDSEILLYTSIRGEEVFFKLQHGHDFNGDYIGLSCLPYDPSQMAEQDKDNLRPDHIFYSDGISYNDNLSNVKNIIHNTIVHTQLLDEMVELKYAHSFIDIKEYLRYSITENRTSKDIEYLSTKRNFEKLTDIMASGRSKNVFNDHLNSDISIDKGHTGKDGYGLLHIIEGRHTKDKINGNELTALLYKIMDSAMNGSITDSITIKQRKDDERIGIEKDGIIAIAGRRIGTHENFVITGYEINNKKEEAAEAIQTVIAQYGRTPEFSDFRKQVGAAVSSLKQVSPQSDNKSREIETAKKAGYVQGVCECVAALGNDYALGKKLLTEMNVSQKMAKEFARPETYRTLENGIFAQKEEQKLERWQKRGRHHL